MLLPLLICQKKRFNRAHHKLLISSPGRFWLLTRVGCNIVVIFNITMKNPATVWSLWNRKWYMPYLFLNVIPQINVEGGFFTTSMMVWEISTDICRVKFNVQWCRALMRAFSRLYTVLSQFVISTSILDPTVIRTNQIKCYTSGRLISILWYLLTHRCVTFSEVVLQSREFKKYHMKINQYNAVYNDKRTFLKMLRLHEQNS